MEIVLNAAVPPPPARVTPRNFPTSTPTNRKYVNGRSVSCLGKNGEDHALSRGPFQPELDGHDKVEMPQSVKNGPEKKHKDIWQLFTEAQQNILYLNKQRVKALVELDKVKGENKSLLDKIEQLKEKNQANLGKDKLSITWELLLRIDSMVVKGLIDKGEASNLRRLVMDSKVCVGDDFSGILHKGDAELLVELRNFSEKNKRKAFYVVHICTEMAPIVSVGSLASYVTGLSRALQRKGNLVEIILPKYTCLNLDAVQGLQENEAEFYSFFNGQLHGNRIWTGVIYGLGITLIQPMYDLSFFSCESVYGYSNDFERFSYFSRASLDYIVKSGKQPDVLHIHNWETSIIGPLFWDVFVKQGLEGTRILLTCHGFDSQCLEQPDKLAQCGLDPSRLHRPDRLEDNSKTHLVNILKGGIVYSNKVIIISSMHLKGQIIQNMGHGLEPTLALHKDKILVAPGGFDNSTWDPSTDKFLPQSYSADDMRGKSVCKVALQQQLGLSENASLILVGCIFSEVSDVDLENLKTLVWIASGRGVQFVLMGVAKTLAINRALEAFHGELKGQNVIFLNKYDQALSRLIFAGSDIILCRSLDDPILQVPLKALRYGAAPITANVTENQFRYVVDHGNEGTRFAQYMSSTFASMSLSQAIDELKNSPSQWNRKIMDAMRRDFSWDAECCDIHLSAYASAKNL